MEQLQLPFLKLPETLVKFFHYRFGYWERMSKDWFNEGLSWAEPFIQGKKRNGSFIGFSHLIVDPELSTFTFEYRKDEFKIIMRDSVINGTRRCTREIPLDVDFSLKDILHFVEDQR